MLAPPCAQETFDGWPHAGWPVNVFHYESHIHASAARWHATPLATAASHGQPTMPLSLAQHAARPRFHAAHHLPLHSRPQSEFSRGLRKSQLPHITRSFSPHTTAGRQKPCRNTHYQEAVAVSVAGLCAGLHADDGHAPPRPLHFSISERTICLQDIDLKRQPHAERNSRFSASRRYLVRLIYWPASFSAPRALLSSQKYGRQHFDYFQECTARPILFLPVSALDAIGRVDQHFILFIYIRHKKYQRLPHSTCLYRHASAYHERAAAARDIIMRHGAMLRMISRLLC